MKVIKDSLLKNHYIQIDEYNYSSYEVKTSKKNKEYSNLLGHYPSMNLALESILSSIVKESLSDTSDLKEYIVSLEDTFNEIKKLKIK